MCPPVIQRLLGRLHHVCRSREIRFADLQMHHAPPSRLERARPYQHIERRFHADARHSVSQSHVTFRKKDTPSNRRVSTTRSEIWTVSPSMRAVTREPSSNSTIATW